MEKKLQSSINSLPDLPGIYQFFDRNEILIYVGKAINIRKRVSSYFTGNITHPKVKALVSKIESVKPIVVDTESDALLLENNLIKKHQPRYNVLLRDDKSFPWICIKNEWFPRVFSTRQVIRDGSFYFGPYTSGKMIKTILDLIRHLFPLRNCNYKLTEENIARKSFRTCLEYHIGNCKAPCIGLQDHDDYNRSIEGIRNILKGNINHVVSYLESIMLELSASFRFEEAQKIKEKIELINKYKSRSTIVSPTLNNMDVFSIVDNESFAFVNYLKVMNGSIVQAHNLEIKKKLDESPREILPLVITDLRSRLNNDSTELIVPFALDYQFQGVIVTVPLKGEKKKLLDLSERNARQYQLEMMKAKEKAVSGKRWQRILETAKKDLHLKQLPVHIECFDISNIQGDSAVASCVVFRNARPYTSDYRHFNIKTVTGINDFASMEEVVLRRYRRMIEQNQSLPQLIIIDGGKGQLNAAIKALKKLDLEGKMAILGIAKKLEEIFFPGDKDPLFLSKKSESLRLIQQIRNEAHRFGLKFHHTKRSAGMVKSEIENISGIGVKTHHKLLEKYGSLKNVKKVDFEELAKFIGEQKAKNIIDYFKKEE